MGGGLGWGKKITSLFSLPSNLNLVFLSSWLQATDHRNITTTGVATALSPVPTQDPAGRWARRGSCLPPPPPELPQEPRELPGLQAGM